MGNPVIVEAVRSPRVHPVAVKSRDQQQIQALHRIREQWKRTRTQRINGMRGLLREYDGRLPDALHAYNRGRRGP